MYAGNLPAFLTRSVARLDAVAAGTARRRGSAPPVSFRYQALERHEPAAVAEGGLDLVRRLEQLRDPGQKLLAAQEAVHRRTHVVAAAAARLLEHGVGGQRDGDPDG